MRILLIVLIITSSIIAHSQTNKALKLKKGNWIGELKLSKNDILPFDIVVSKSNGNYIFNIENGEEMIQMKDPIQKGDSLYVHFPYFNSELIFTTKSSKELSGYWVNYNKKNYRIPFSAKKSKSTRFDVADKKLKNKLSVDGKWAVTFEPNTNSAYPAVGIFNQDEKKNKVEGTFLTETGDYRFLAGNIVGDSLFLSCFDGSHAFLFKAAIDGDNLSGIFRSGTHWKSNWIGNKDASAELTNPEELTYLVGDEEVNFTLKDLAGNDFSFPNEDFQNKVVIIQLMGTWCPNCLDESKYFKSLYSKYHNNGLEIISIGYEVSGEFEKQVASIERFKNALELDFNFLVGGKASKNVASEQFNMLNEVISFPTTIIIGRDGKVQQIHTGFNGPGTGEYYQNYVEKTNSLIESLLAH